MSIKLLHAADLHLDSPFDALPAGKAAIRRAEQRELLSRLAALAVKERVDAVLLAGDLLDSSSAYYETGEQLSACLGRIPAPVFISPGNHDCLSPRSPYLRLTLPENVFVFPKNTISCADVSSKGFRVFGAAFTDSSCRPLLAGFHAERREGVLNLMCIHGDVNSKSLKYNPISEDDLARSGMDYVALGHVHTASGLRKAGDTFWSYPGCPEGRGFDECGEKTVSIVEVERGSCTVTPVCISGRRYECLEVDVSDAEPLLAVHSALPDETIRDIYRITLKGETASGVDLSRLHEALGEFFFELQLRDKTTLRHDIWDKAGEDSLRGLFLMKLKAIYDSALTDEERTLAEQAARWGLAALNNAEEVVRHEN